MAEAGFITIVSLISPLKEGRERPGGLCSSFFEVYIKTSLKKCEERDTKGLYELARKGEIPHFTGVSSPYEEPETPDLVVDTENLTRGESLSLLEGFIQEKFVGPLAKNSINHYQI